MSCTGTWIGSIASVIRMFVIILGSKKLWDVFIQKPKVECYILPEEPYKDEYLSLSKDKLIDRFRRGESIAKFLDKDTVEILNYKSHPMEIKPFITKTITNSFLVSGGTTIKEGYIIITYNDLVFNIYSITHIDLNGKKGTPAKFKIELLKEVR